MTISSIAERIVWAHMLAKAVASLGPGLRHTKIILINGIGAGIASWD
jgi:hypothetical protein